MEIKAEYPAPIHTKYLKADLISQLENLVSKVMNGEGYGEVTIVIRAGRIKFVSTKEVESAMK